MIQKPLENAFFPEKFSESVSENFFADFQNIFEISVMGIDLKYRPPKDIPLNSSRPFLADFF